MERKGIQVFEDKQVRTVWDEKYEKWYFSIVDVVGILSESKDPASYWRKLKQRLKEEGNQTVTNCHALKLQAADGKMRMTDVADSEQLFRLIQSIPSPKAEPFKVWMAQVAALRADQMQDPELSIQQAVADYTRLGYSEQWIKQRIRSIDVRNDLTSEWQRAGVKEGQEYATLTNIITQAWSGRNVQEYKRHKGLHKENLRDNMTNMELTLNTLAELTTTELHKQQNPQGYKASAKLAKEGGSVAGNARREIEAKLGHSVISSAKASDYLSPIEPKKELPIESDEKQ